MYEISTSLHFPTGSEDPLSAPFLAGAAFFPPLVSTTFSAAFPFAAGFLGSLAAPFLAAGALPPFLVFFLFSSAEKSSSLSFYSLSSLDFSSSNASDSDS